jgi:hypothetical protein
MRPPTNNERDKLLSMMNGFVKSDAAYWTDDPAVLYIRELTKEKAPTTYVEEPRVRCSSECSGGRCCASP